MALQEQPKSSVETTAESPGFIKEGLLTLEPGQVSQETVDKLLPLGNGLSVPKDVHSAVMTSCELTAWPSEVFRALLPSVTKVDASKNSISFEMEVTMAPTVHFFPANLTHLNLSGNKIQELPVEFWRLACLVELDLSHNLLETVGESFGSARSVKELDLSHNYLQRPPRWLSGLTRARKVRLNDNTMASTAFEDVGPDFGRNCRSLRLLDISSCALRGLDSPHVFQAKDLKVLVLGRSGEVEGGEELSAAAVSILKNSIPALPKEIGLSSGLVTLVASGINLSDVPEEIKLLKNLKRLDLSCNDIHWLPSTLVDLERLEVLNLSGNHLDSLPFKIEKLPSLRELYVASNGVCWITEDIGKSKCCLRVLDLYQNKLDLEGARPLKELDLEQLDLGANQLGMDDIVTDMQIKDYLDKQARLRDSLGVSQKREDPGKEAPAKFDDDCRFLGKSWTDDDIDDCESADADVESNCFGEEEGEGDDNNPWADEGEEKSEKDVAMRASPPRFLWTELGMGEEKEKEKAKSENEDEADEEEERWSSDGRYSRTSSNYCRAPKYDFDDMSKYISGRFDFCPSDGHAKPVREESGRARANFECAPERRPGRKVPRGVADGQRRSSGGRDRTESSGSDANQFADAD